MKNKLITIVKIFLLVFFSLIWFILIQVEYEIITKPELQNDFPIIKGVYAIYLLGFILLILIAIILFLLYSIKKTIMEMYFL